MKNGIIAFCGSKGAGKSTSATLFKDAFKGETEELAFAGHLKETCSKVFNIPIGSFLNPALKEKELEDYALMDEAKIRAIFASFNVNGLEYDKNIRPYIGQVLDTPRRLLQYVGTELLHPIDPLIHAKTTLVNKDPNKLSIITDLRFLNEFNYLKSLSSFVPVFIANARAEAAAAGDMHPSEREVLLFKTSCVLLNNNGSMGELKQAVETLITERFT